MRRFPFVVLVSGMAWLLLASGSANAQEKPRPKALGAPERLGGPLVPTAVEERLKLTAEQKEKLAKIEKEFADKAKDETKLREQMQKARDDKDRAALRAALEQIAEAGKVRAGYETKVQEILTGEQKKTFEAALGGTGAGRPGIGIGPGTLLPGLQRLDLTAEQKEKLNQLQKEFEAKALQVLTEEQRKKYEELKGRVRRPESRQRESRTRTSAAPFQSSACGLFVRRDVPNLGL